MPEHAHLWFAGEHDPAVAVLHFRGLGDELFSDVLGFPRRLDQSVLSLGLGTSKPIGGPNLPALRN